MTDHAAVMVSRLNELGYLHVLRMPGGWFAGIQDMIYTTGLVCGLNDFGYERRYCYERRQDAIDALLIWDGRGDPPGPWIKEKPSDRLGPGALNPEPLPQNYSKTETP